MPILAKALFKFEGTQSDDLSFDEDEVLTIVAKDESGWWTGRTNSGRQGDFPFNYVEVLDEAATQAYLKKQAQGDAGSLAFTGDHVDSIEIRKHDMGPKGGQLTLESSLNNGTREQVVKTLVDLRAFDTQLRTVVPDFEGKLPPKWADRALLPASLMERRKEALDAYLQKLVISEGVDFLLVPFLFPGRKAQLTEEGFAAAARAQKAAAEQASQAKPESPPSLARAEYAWDPTDPVELRLEAGDIICVLSQTTGSDGWWDGQTAEGSRGLFPYNHVELLTPQQVALVMEGKALPPPTAHEASPIDKTKGEHKKAPGERPVKVVPGFQIGSVQAFDDMLDKGFAVENVQGGNAAGPKPGDFVVLNFKAHVWDCQAQAIVEFLASDDKGEGPMEFVVDGDPNVVKGLHVAVQRIPVGASARIIISPKLGYGVAGLPPAIPSLATLVFDVHLMSAGPPKQAPSSTPKQKPEVKARTQDSAPRVMSLRAMVPLLNREDRTPKKVDEPSPVAAAPAAIVAGTSTKAHEPTRRAGHVVVSTTAPPSAAAAPVEKKAPAPQVPKYDLKELQELVKANKIDAMGLDRAQLEDYLNEKAFFEAFLMDRGHFLLKPLWRQQALKRAVGLF